MDAVLVDAIARRLAATTPRRPVLALLALAAGSIALPFPHPEAQARKKNKKKRKDKNKSPGSDTCEGDGRRGEECGPRCECLGDYQCGDSHLTEDGRIACGEPHLSELVCCRGRGDTCNGNDCECCGRLKCGSSNRCEPDCQDETGTFPDGTCCPFGRCQDGRCSPISKSPTNVLGDCQGVCDLPGIRPASVTVCGVRLQCPDCDTCASLCGGPNSGHIAAFNPVINAISEFCVADLIDTRGDCTPDRTCFEGVCRDREFQCYELCLEP